MTPIQYANTELIAQRFPQLLIDGAAGTFWLCSSDWMPLKGKHYSSKQAAMADRSKILDRASKAAR